MTSSSSSASPPISSSPGDPLAEVPDQLCDVRGEICPFTFVRAKLALEALPLGAALRVLVDHEPASRNLPRSAAEWGQEVLGVTEVTDAGGPNDPPGPRARVWAIDLRKRVR